MCYLTLSPHTSVRIRGCGGGTDNFLQPGALAQRDRASERGKSRSQQGLRVPIVLRLSMGVGYGGGGLIGIGNLMAGE